MLRVRKVRRNVLLLGLSACSAPAFQHPPPDYAFGAGILNQDDWNRQPPVPPAQPVVQPEPQPPPQPKQVPPPRPPELPKVEATPIVQPVPEKPQQEQPVEPQQPKPPQHLVGTTRTAADLRGIQRVEAATALLGTPGLQDRAFVAHVLRAAGQDLEVDRSRPYAPALFELLAHKGLTLHQQDPRPGDLIFFKNTADLNANGRADDGVTLVGVVERVNGTRVVLIAQRAGKVRRLAADPTQPTLVRDAKGEVVNTRLVRWPGADGPLTAGQCLAGYARP